MLAPVQAMEPRMKQVLVIGIGAGNPEYITVQAINALNRVDVFFLLDKGEEKSDLARLRREILQRYVTAPKYRMVEVDDPPRGKTASGYREDVAAWRAKRLAIFAAMLADELKDGECGAFLVWGDPSLYDGTISILDDILAAGHVAFDFEVIPGISSVMALAARHRIALNRVGETVQITTGRRLAEGMPGGADNLVVMLDSAGAFRALQGEDFDIYWGAYLGTGAEVLRAGKLAALIDEIERLRAAGRAEHGWIMDTYLLRRPRSA